MGNSSSSQEPFRRFSKFFFRFADSSDLRMPRNQTTIAVFRGEVQFSTDHRLDFFFIDFAITADAIVPSCPSILTAIPVFVFFGIRHL